MSNKDSWMPCALPWILKGSDEIEEQINSQLCQRLKNESAKAKWRSESVKEGLIRWDVRPPDVIFKDGFLPRGIPINDKLPISYGLVDLWDWVINHNRSIFVSTAKTFTSGTEIRRWVPNDVTCIYEYTIYAHGGIDVNPTLGEHQFQHQHEISFPGGVRPVFIYSARQYDLTGTVIRVWINRGFDLTANGKYQVSLSKIPDVLNQSFGVQITHWLAPGRYEYYHMLPTDNLPWPYEERPEPMSELGAAALANLPHHNVQPRALMPWDLWKLVSNEYEPMTDPGSETKDVYLSRHPIRACLDLTLYGFPEEAWFFMDSNCVRITTIDGEKKVIDGPTPISEQWKSLKDLGFTTVDAFLPFKGGAFVFSGEKYGQLAIVPQAEANTEDTNKKSDDTKGLPGNTEEQSESEDTKEQVQQLVDTVVSGPSLITDGWKSLEEVGLRRVEAILPHPTNDGEAYFFIGKLFVHVKFDKDKKTNAVLAGPSIIVDKWTSLENAGFDSVDCILATSTARQAWVFKGTRYLLVDIIVEEPNYVCHDWAPLVQAGFY